MPTGSSRTASDRLNAFLGSVRDVEHIVEHHARPSLRPVWITLALGLLLLAVLYATLGGG